MATEQRQIRRDTAANWASVDPTPASGELCYETDTGVLKIGDGVSAYSSLGAALAALYQLPIPMPRVAGTWCTSQVSGGGTATAVATAANRLDLYPFWTPVAFSIDRLSVNVVTGVAASNCRVVIYAAASDGPPSTRLHESGNIDTSTSSTFPEVAASFTFAANTLHWVGVHTSGAPQIRAMNTEDMCPLGLASNTQPYTGVVLRTTPTFGSTLANYVYDAAQTTSQAPGPIIRMRVA